MNDKKKHGINWIDIDKVHIFIMLWKFLSTNLNQVTITNIISGEPRSTLYWLFIIITLQSFSILVHLNKIYARFIIFILSILLFEFVWLSRFHLPYFYVVNFQGGMFAIVNIVLPCWIPQIPGLPEISNRKWRIISPRFWVR
jgi:hypothetical protein